MEKNIAVIYGDCASPEIVTQALRVLDAVAEKFGHTFTYTKVLMGGEAIDAYGDPLPQSELDKCLQSDSVLRGPSAAPSGRACPVTSGRKRASCGSGPAWGFTPTTALPKSGPSWRTPRP